MALDDPQNIAADAALKARYGGVPAGAIRWNATIARRGRSQPDGCNPS